jgi:Mannose-6-phosphate isomerase
MNNPMNNPMNNSRKRCQENPPCTNNSSCPPKSNDHGPAPFVINIKEATLENNNFRTALWTGCHLQLTLMCINPNDDIGLEIHPETDQLLVIEQGQGIIMMGECKENLKFKKKVCENDAIFIPAGTWHNLMNIGCEPLKLYSVYAPPQHPFGTVHVTKEDAEEHH